ncbi:hypothetical protein [Rossellomorea sp. NRS-1567]|uniref:hypothetical protein n=1 Tax=Rossellomorea sp. NRS-1567 TaxID=3233901 RepID=UPI003D2CDF70
MIDIKYVVPNTTDTSLRMPARINRLADTCPHCHYGISPKIMNVILNNSTKNQDSLEVVYYCTRQTCQHLFISYYRVAKNGSRDFYFLNSAPIRPMQRKFEEEINDISPEFSVIYNQAKEAEESQLNHVAGMGYRKSLEYLIKDYLISFREEDKEEIGGKFLGKCIKENVTDRNVQNVAIRAVWLGNDETHYVRKWGNKDINDLKQLIELTLYWVSSEIKTQKLLQEMQ